jgi:hypothetical protein
MAAERKGSTRLLIVLGAAVALAVVGGCGGEARVAGTVTLEGEPVAGALVAFVAADDKTAPVVAQSDDAGGYALVGNKGGGVPAGKYKVVVTRMALKDGTVPTGERLEQARARGLLQNVLPPAYADRATTPLQFDLGGGGNTINLALKKRP